MYMTLPMLIEIPLQLLFIPIILLILGLIPRIVILYNIGTNNLVYNVYIYNIPI